MTLTKNHKGISYLILILISCSCIRPNSMKSGEREKEYFYLDVAGDSRTDTLFIKKASNDSYREIFLFQSGKEENILTVKPRLASQKKYVTTNPRIEIIRLESNYTQSDDKELRIIIRNTDMMPDYIFVDLKYDRQWIVKRYYMCNSNSDQAVSISVIQIDRPLCEEFGENKLLDQGQILSLFSKEKETDGCDSPETLDKKHR